MAEPSQGKVGIIACCGEELAEGTATRLAALKVLHEWRRGKTVTICLPLFLAGGEGERAFARSHPTITVDGCELRCAARGTEMHSGKPAAEVVITDLVVDRGLDKVEGRRQLNDAGKQAVEIAARRVAELVDQILERPAATTPEGTSTGPTLYQIEPVPCACGSGAPRARSSK